MLNATIRWPQNDVHQLLILNDMHIAHKVFLRTKSKDPNAATSMNVANAVENKEIGCGAYTCRLQMYSSLNK